MSPRQERKESAWFAIIDAQRCRLLRFARTASAIAHVEELSALECTWPDHEPGRPMALGGMTGHSYAVPPNYVEEQMRRFMRETVTWLKAECTARQIDRLVILASPRALALLRKSVDLSNGRFDFRPGDLTKFSTSALAVHPLVRGLLDKEATNEPTSLSNDGEEVS